MINLTLKKKSITDILAFIGTVFVVGLMIIYLNNAYQLNLYSTQWLQLGILIIGICLLIFYHKLNKFMVIVFLFSLSMLIPSVFYSLDEYGIMNLVSKTFLWFFVIIIGYGYGKSKEINGKVYLIWGMLLILICIYCSNTFLDFSISNKNYVQTSIYYLICMLPFIYIFPQKKIKLFFLILICLLTFISFKRSAIVVLLITLLINICINVKKINIKQIFKYLILIILIFSIIFSIYMKMKNWNINDLMDIFNIWNNRLGESGARESIYSYVLQMQFDSSILEWIFGHGYNAVKDTGFYGLSSHCDYLEILFNYGIISEILFLYFIITLIKRTIRLVKQNSIFGNGYASSVIIFTIASLPSHMLTYSTYFLIICFFWGYMESINENCKERKKML